MRNFAPVSWLLARKVRECRSLRDELTAERIRLLACEARLGAAAKELHDLARDFAEKRDLVEDLLVECSGLRKVNAELMRACPNDLRDLGEAG